MPKYENLHFSRKVKSPQTHLQTRRRCRCHLGSVLACYSIELEAIKRKLKNLLQISRLSVRRHRSRFFFAIEIELETRLAFLFNSFSRSQRSFQLADTGAWERLARDKGASVYHKLIRKQKTICFGDWLSGDSTCSSHRAANGIGFVDDERAKQDSRVKNWSITLWAVLCGIHLHHFITTADTDKISSLTIPFRPIHIHPDGDFALSRKSLKIPLCLRRGLVLFWVSQK